MSSWVSPSMSRFNRRPGGAESTNDTDANAAATATSTSTSAGASAGAGVGPSYEAVQLGSGSVMKPLTPPKVANLTENTCLSVSAFKELLRQYRSLDDGITTRLNRSFARSRDLGDSSAPSLLSSSTGRSTDSKDLGTSTYGTPTQTACLELWNQLTSLWIGREEVVRFCVNVVDAQTSPTTTTTLAKHQQSTMAPPSPSKFARDSRLDADLSPPSSSHSSYTSSGSRAESSIDVLKRQLHNELTIEQIIRARSLDAFKSRCRFFQPNPPPGPQGDRERAMWAGKPTPLHQETRDSL
ncbi:hypothetical protein BCV70DRAFT_220305 [Testicularia cyperi]|uniref:Uncharacterized protein n=1 Tax=Testicularia cyperi TaxID=1882483 RepID=A0A317XZI8_9BASI|nr:hypothetical protein BCV70DRAFT_220305 [Testicularia cyperi]